MKKWLIALAILILILIAFLYLFIPNVISINRDLSIKANAQGLYRKLAVNKNWGKWWPGIDTNPAIGNLESIFYLNGHTYTITDKSISSLFISISGKDIFTKTFLHVIPLNRDSVKLIWAGEMPTSKNPFNRLQKYFKAKDIKKDIEKILDEMNFFFSKNENIYGTSIKQELVVDSILVSTYQTSVGYPTIPFIYGLIDQLKNYAQSQSAKETGYPMLNIGTTDSINFLTRVAIPVNKRLKDSGTIAYKWMLGGGKILVTEINGGLHSLKNGLREIEQYVTDHGRAAPAIPFQALLTDRRKEPDTSKWVTKIFYPVM